MKIWITIKWIKNDMGRWVVMSVHPGYLLPVRDNVINYTVQEVTLTGESLLIPPKVA